MCTKKALLHCLVGSRRDLAFKRCKKKAAGWNAQIAYSYWGGTGISRYAGLAEGYEKRAAQCDALLAANDYYDYFIKEQAEAIINALAK